MTKRRVKRRKEISAERKLLSLKDMTEFFDRLKHKLKNLARKNRQQKARQQQRKWDKAFIRSGSYMGILLQRSRKSSMKIIKWIWNGL